ncbi:hypothetical protein [Spirosoma sp. KUDC1026]|nr:hypothetical protein [Spirosoma sp. KUDC1026]QKZ13416.1 hypothetical protein HU175_12535 [Spirosoma sp. KUDC1026]
MVIVIDTYQMIPDSQLAIVPKAGYIVFLENFLAVWASLMPFIKNPN